MFMATLLRSDVRKRGFLYKLPVSGGVLKVWAKRWVVLRNTSHEGVVRLEYFDKEEDEIKDVNKRVILLRNCTGCCEASEHKKSKPHAFQFTSTLGHHVFATDSKDELDEWTEEINLAIQDDRRKQRRRTRSKASISPESNPPRNSTAITHPTTLMGVYRVMIEDNEFSRKLGVTGIHSLNVTPRGIKLISSTDESTIASWHYKHIRTYAKSANKKVIIEIGSNKTGSGKLELATASSREMFSMIHKNIKTLRAKQEEARQAEIKKEVEEISEKQRKKRSSLIRPHSMSYELQNPLPKQTSKTKRTSYPSFAEQSTIDNDLIQLEGFGGQNQMDEDLQEFIDSFDPVANSESRHSSNYIIAPLPVLDSVNDLSSSVYETTSFPSPSSKGVHESAGPISEGFEDSFTSNVQKQKQNTNPFTDSMDPFTDSVDPFATSAQGSFYNSQEDIFDGFDTSNRKTSTPSSKYPSTNPFAKEASTKSNSFSTNPFEITEGLQNAHISKDDHNSVIPNKSKKMSKKMSQEEFDKVWEDITSNLVLP